MTEEKRLLRELVEILKRAEEIVSILGDDNPELSTMTDTQQDYEEKINGVLRRLGAPVKNKGYRYIKEAILQCLDDSTIFESGITKVLYPSVALMFNTTPSRVERAIRHEVEIIFSEGNTEFVNELFPYCMGKATNSEFLATLVEYLRAN